jgi:hypothetical protein
MSRSAASGLEHFHRLNGSVYIHEPTTTASSPNEPDLILICGWMDARPRHVAKYTAGYEKLYPSARIIAVITTAVDVVFTTTGANVKRVKPVLDIFYTLPPSTKILAHFFSNGGAFTTMLIAKKYLEKTGKSLPITAVILDSTPGRASYEATIQAFSVALPKDLIVKAIVTWILRLCFWIYRFAYFLEGLIGMKEVLNLVDKVRIDLNTKSLMDIATPRLYIYSKGDNMVGWQDVEEHIEEAEKLGYVVAKEKFLESGHCAHLLIDPEKYWAAVQRLLNTRLETSRAID